MSKKQIEVKPMDVKTIIFEIVGVTPLLMNKNMMAVSIKEKSPEEICELKTHWIDKKNNVVGFPATGFLGCLQNAAKRFDDISGKAKSQMITSGVRILPDDNDLVKIDYKECVIDERIAYNSNAGGKGGAAITSFRPCFKEWKCSLKVNYVVDIIQEKQLIGLMERAGYCIGTGSYSPAKNGIFGQFKIGKIQKKK